MKILTLDASTHSTGYAIGEEEQLQLHGCITAASRDVIKRIIKMRDQIQNLVKNNQIKKIIMQEVRPDFSSHTNKVLMWLQAAIVISAYQIDSSIQFEFIEAVKWRAALKMKQGRGIKRPSLKLQDIQYVKDKYNIIVNDDEADAICLFDAYWQKFDNEINWE